MSATNDTAKAFNKVAPQIGDALADGWFLAGPDPENPDNDLLIEPKATRLCTATWYEAEEHAEALKKEGFKTARLPSFKQLRSIFENVVKPGKNDNAQLVTGSSEDAKWHWSSEARPGTRGNPRVMSLAVGDQGWGYKGVGDLSAVCVRSEPRSPI